MPWPWNRPRSPSGLAVSNGHTIIDGDVSASPLSPRPTGKSVRRTASTSSRSTTPTPASVRSSTVNNRAASSLGFHHETQQKSPNSRRHSRDITLNSSPASNLRTASVIPEEQIGTDEGFDYMHVQLEPQFSDSMRPRERRGSTSQSSDILSRPQPSVESLSSLASSSLQSDANSNLLKRSLSLATGSHLSILSGPTSPNYANGRAFSPTPSIGSISHTNAIARSQKAIVPPGSRQANSDDVFYELPESYEQVNGLNSMEIEERDLRHKAIVDSRPMVGAGAGRAVSRHQSRESMLEAEVARLRKLCDRYKRTSVNGSSVSSTDLLVIPEATLDSSGGSEAHRVVKVMKVANEHLQKKIDARDAMLADRLSELEQIYSKHAIELEQQRQDFQARIDQLARQHEVEKSDISQQSSQQLEALHEQMSRSIQETTNNQDQVDKITALQHEIEIVKAREIDLANSHDRAIDEIKSRASEDLRAAKRAFAEAEENWEIKTEQMRRELLDRPQAADCACSSGTELMTIERMKLEHQNEITALKTSIRILESSRGTTVEQLEEDQRVYRRVSELEASLAGKVRALTAERRTSERLRANLTSIEESKTELQLEKEAVQTELSNIKKAHQNALLEANSKSAEARAEERRLLEEEIKSAHQRDLKEWLELKVRYESDLEIEKATVSQLREQHATDAQEFDNRITELIKEHLLEKDQLESSQEQRLRVREKEIRDQMDAEIAKSKDELTKLERSFQDTMQERDAEVQELKTAASDALQQLQIAFEKSKAVFMEEQKVALNAANELHEKDREAFQSERQHLEKLLADARSEYQSFQAHAQAQLEEQVKLSQTQFDMKLSRLEAEKQAELDSLKSAMESLESREREKRQILEDSFEVRLRDTERDYILKRESEKQMESAKYEELAHRLEEVRQENDQRIAGLNLEVEQTKDRAAIVVTELQQQLKDEDEAKQQLLDRVAKAEMEKELADKDFQRLKAELAAKETDLFKHRDLAAQAEYQIKALGDANSLLKDEMESQKQASARNAAELRADMQIREKTAHEIHARSKQEIEDLQFQLRTANTKLTMGEVELESIKETIRESEEALAAIRNERDAGRKSLDDEKRALTIRHDQIVEGHLMTIAKLEDIINKIRARTTDEARVNEAKLLEQQTQITHWMTSANRKNDDIQRLERMVKEANTRAESFKLDVRALKNDLKQAEKEAKERAAETKALTKDLKMMREENVFLRKEVGSSSNTSSRHVRQISDMESRIQSLSKEIQESRNELSSQKRTVAKRESMIRQLEDALQQRGRNGRSSPGPNAALASMENGIVPASSSSSNSALQRDLRDSRAEVSRLNEKLEMYETEYRHFFEDNEKMKSEHETAIMVMQSKLDSCIPELEKLRKSKKDLEQRLQGAELRLATSGGLVRRGTMDSVDSPVTPRSQSSMA